MLKSSFVLPILSNSLLPGNLKALSDQYSEIVNKNELFRNLHDREEKLKVPVNLTIFESYYQTFDFYKYRDEYSFKDRIFVFDARKPINHLDTSYKQSNAWLSGLRRTNSQDYFGKEYKQDHGINSSSHVNWMDGRSDSSSKLSNILWLDLPEKTPKPFIPQEKRIVLKYDYNYDGRIREYASYISRNPNKPLENIYSRIEYGKLKNFKRDLVDSFSSVFFSNKNDLDCEQAKNKFHFSNLKFSSVDEDGFEIVCGGFNVNQKHPDFPHLDSRKWSTPYVAYKRYFPYYWKNEFYFYTLGEFSNKYGYSGVNLNQNPYNNSLWFINYDDVFSVGSLDDDPFKLKVYLNKDKNIFTRDFLKISSAFNFQLSFKVNGIYKSKIFSLDEVLRGDFLIDLNLSDKGTSPLFSDFSVKVIKKGDSNSHLLEFFGSDASNLTFKVNIDSLEKGNRIFNRLLFDETGMNSFFPSQFLEDSNLIKYFFISNEQNRKVRITEDIYKKLKVKVEFDDKRGHVFLKYFDYIDNLEKESKIIDLKKLPSTEDLKIDDLNDKDEIKKILTDRFGLQDDYLFKNIDFELKEVNSLQDYLQYRIVVNHPNYEVRSQWEKHFQDKTIFVVNKSNLSLLPNWNSFKKSTTYDSSNIFSLFSLNENAKSKNISIHDYKFLVVKQNSDELIVSAELEHPKGKRIYRFGDLLSTDSLDRLNTLSSSSPTSSSTDESDLSKLDFLKNSSSPVRYFVYGLTSAIGISSLGLLGFRGLKFLKNRFA